MEETKILSERKWLWGIVIVTILVLSVVCLLFYLQPSNKAQNSNLYILPFINCCINAAVSLCLLLGLYFILNKNIRAHRVCMLSAFSLSTFFLVLYIIFHYMAPETRFGDLNHNHLLEPKELKQVGSIRMVYFLILISHILLAATIVPLALITLFRIFNLDVVRHRKIARITWPIWFYVSISGVVVYTMIRVYYPV